ncbi:sulfonate ABC transporter substrate-binding protein [uncultured Oxalicibacterium sp.]|uniref:sulfonate ABC transporter substrate-binding protein n=1 Tax=uncultured Oxalicibacterium sp. TaxID=1168540 RepID=UPI0025DEBE8F|nr:sulfonate ABC transporter substrate-binding protein [uncultured Oxalicibacterium sp.]
MSNHDVKRQARRRTLSYLSAALVGAATSGLPFVAGAQSKSVLRIGYQKYGTLVILKGRGTLEKRLAAEGVELKWTEFAAGPALLEGLNVGSIDFGTAGEAPPIFAQAAGADLVYVGNEPPAPASEAIIVPKNSPIKSVAELKGKRVALNRGSNVHYLWVKALERAGLAYADVQTVFLAPADARAAFERGSLDAWVIWDPFLAAAEKQIGARVLEDGTGLVANHQFFLASRSYAQKHPRLIAILLEELDKVDQWGAKNLKEIATVLAEQTGLDQATVELAAKRYAYGVKPISEQVLAEQQKIADAFAQLKLIPKPIRVRDAVLVARP